MSKYVMFVLSEKQYGIDIGYVQSIELVQPITRVLGTAPYIKGVMNLRGELVPIIDMRNYFGLPEPQQTQNQRIVIATYEGETIGLLVDTASTVIEIEDEDVESIAEIFGSVESRYLHGIANLQDEAVGIFRLDTLGAEIKKDHSKAVDGGES